MSEFNVKGTIKTILPTETGVAKSSGKEWSKLNFIVTNNDGYEGREQIYCFQIFGAERVEKFLKFNSEGAEVDVKFDIQVNEYSGRYFTNLSAFHVASGERVEQATQTPAPEEEDSEILPF
jgi:hypothetical protein